MLPLALRRVQRPVAIDRILVIDLALPTDLVLTTALALATDRGLVRIDRQPATDPSSAVGIASAKATVRSLAAGITITLSTAQAATTTS